MTGMGRETGLAKDQGQERPGMPGTLNPGGFGAMTAILDVAAQRRRKPRGHNGLTGDCRHRDPQDGKSGRNMYLGRRTTVSGTSHVDFGGVPVTVWSPLIATIDAMHATGMESSRFRYDDRRSERYHAADLKTLRLRIGCRRSARTSPRRLRRSRGAGR